MASIHPPTQKVTLSMLKWHAAWILNNILILLLPFSIWNRKVFRLTSKLKTGLIKFQASAFLLFLHWWEAEESLMANCIPHTPKWKTDTAEKTEMTYYSFKTTTQTAQPWLIKVVLYIGYTNSLRAVLGTVIEPAICGVWRGYAPLSKYCYEVSACPDPGWLPSALLLGQ